MVGKTGLTYIGRQALSQKGDTTEGRTSHDWTEGRSFCQSRDCTKIMAFITGFEADPPPKIQFEGQNPGGKQVLFSRRHTKTPRIGEAPALSG